MIKANVQPLLSKGDSAPKGNPLDDISQERYNPQNQPKPTNQMLLILKHDSFTTVEMNDKFPHNTFVKQKAHKWKFWKLK